MCVYIPHGTVYDGHSMEHRPKTRFGVALTEALGRHHVSLAALAEETSLSYEHLRKLARGLAHPSELAVSAICRVLPLDKQELLRFVIEDKMSRKFKVTVRALPDTREHPDPLLPIKQVWSDLTEEQQETVIGMVLGMAERNRQNKRRPSGKG
jgi:hypothetical protein